MLMLWPLKKAKNAAKVIGRSRDRNTDPSWRTSLADALFGEENRSTKFGALLVNIMSPGFRFSQTLGQRVELKLYVSEAK